MSFAELRRWVAGANAIWHTRNGLAEGCKPDFEQPILKALKTPRPMDLSGAEVVAERRILFFTLHKCASMFIHRVCTDLARISGRAYFSPNGGDFQVSLQEMVTNVGFWQAHKAGCFGPLRLFIEIPEMENDRILLHLRDPRDRKSTRLNSSHSSVSRMPSSA